MTDPVDDILREATPDEKAALVAGIDLWNTPGVPRLGVPGLRVTDGPNGRRGPRWTGQGAACFPCGSALGATWDPAIVERVGRALGEEARTKGAHVLLAPTVNLHRHPLAGRNFECYAEDPHLTARLAVGFVTGVQATGVGVTVKHFVANDSEFERMTISSEVDERTLRELYLVPFEAAVREAGAWGVMSAYNRLNGTYCSEHAWLLTTLLRDEWGFDGFVVSDWFGTHSTTTAASAGLDLEMPGPPHWFGAKLAEAAGSDAATAAALDRMARAVLGVERRTGALDRVGGGEARAVDDPAHRALAREAAAAGFVLLRNETGLLPLDADSLDTVAIVGPGADVAWIMGGGSASLTPHYTVTPLEGLRAALAGRAEVAFARGPAAHRLLPAIDSRRLVGGAVTIEYFASTDLSGAPAFAEGSSAVRQTWMGRWTEAFDASQYSARATGTLLVDETGDWTFGLTTVGPCRVLLDGEVVVDGWDERPRGDSFFGFGSSQITATVALRAGEARALTVEYSSGGASILGGFVLGAAPPEPVDAFDVAVATAGAADVAIVVVGTGPDWESEGRDRDDLELPREQAALVRAVAAANRRTVVCVNAGAPVDTQWADAVPAVLQCWLPGQEWGHALADVLLGVEEPAGRLPTTLPRALDDTPAFATYPGADGRVLYSEGRLIGYRWYDTRGIAPRYPFGHGLGYTTFAYGPARVDATSHRAGDAPDERVRVSLEIRNTGMRTGSEVVQCYVHRVDTGADAPSDEPEQQLRAFEKVRLEAGATRVVDLTLTDRAFASWIDGAWRVEQATFELRIGASSRDIRTRLTFDHPGATLRS